MAHGDFPINCYRPSSSCGPSNYRWINDTDNWIYDEEDTDRPMLCGNLTGARHCPTGRLSIHFNMPYTLWI